MIPLNLESNPFLLGNFAPIESEDEFTLDVIGDLPPGLSGQLLRNGPNPQFPSPDYFWFHGDGMVHSFQIGNGEVRYRNRYVRTPKFLAESRLGRALRNGEAEAEQVPSGLANTNVLKHGERIFALEEMSAPIEMSEDLATRAIMDFGGSMTAHPKVDPRTGELVFFAYSPDGRASKRIDVGALAADGTLISRSTITAPYSSMVHDCFITENYLILPILPLSADLDREAAGGPLYAWDTSLPSQLAVVPRQQGKSEVIWIDVQPGYVFHTVNAYEVGTRIIADTFLFDRAPLFPDAMGNVAGPAAARLGRWEFDLAESDRPAEWKPLDERTGEFPRMDERWLGQRHRHLWFAGQIAAPGTLWFDSLRHVDLETGAAREWKAPEGDAVSEPVFVARGGQEGDGWLLSVAYRAQENRSDLLVFDALNLAQGPVAMAKVPRRVPFGFHGNWIPGH